jgi:chorismate mutase
MGETRCRGIRGAISVQSNTAERILESTRTLLETIVSENEINPDDIASVLFTTTADLNAAFPAAAAREMGWRYVPLICAAEIAVPGSLARCVRVLLHVNTQKSQKEIKHIYLGEAVQLRKDLISGSKK